MRLSEYHKDIKRQVIAKGGTIRFYKDDHLGGVNFTWASNYHRCREHRSWETFCPCERDDEFVKQSVRIGG